MTEKQGCGCGCSSENQGLQISSRPSQKGETQRIELSLSGLTCGHCVASVTEELEELAGVTTVDVDLVANGTSKATVTATSALDDATLRGAIDEAGYQIVGISR